MKPLLYLSLILLPILSYAQDILGDNVNRTVEINVTPSFDCTKAHSEVEQLICSDVDLAILDQKLNKLYLEAKASTNDIKSFKKNNNVAWKEREKYCPTQENVKECVIHWYAIRERVYNQMILESLIESK